MKKGPKKAAGSVTYRPVRRKLIDIVGSVYARCGDQPELWTNVTQVRDDSNDSNELPAIDELEIESIIFDPVFGDDSRRYGIALRAPRLSSVEQIEYPTDRANIPALDLDSRPRDAALRIRMLPKLPDSSEADSSIA